MTWNQTIARAVEAGIGFTIQRPTRDSNEALTLTVFHDTDPEPEMIVCQGVPNLNLLFDEIDRIVEMERPDLFDQRCTYTFPLPSWAGEDQMDPCRCDRPKKHDGEHSCPHIREVDPQP